MDATFGDQHLERVYQQSLLLHSRAHLLHLQCLWAAYYLFIALIHLLRFDFMLIINAISATVCIILQAFLFLKPTVIRYVLYGTVQLLATTTIALLPYGYSALLPISSVIFTIYALIPMRIIYSSIICAALSVLQLLALIFLAQIPLTMSQVTFTLTYLLVFSSDNFIVLKETKKNKLVEFMTNRIMNKKKDRERESEKEEKEMREVKK
uniref:Phosphatidylinositol N-acetylglucosaminyltransferase subunit C n=1 Tax=Elaeophora elaphi TaxID=1147741 RepID=A0A0R3S744_9BILA